MDNVLMSILLLVLVSAQEWEADSVLILILNYQPSIYHKTWFNYNCKSYIGLVHF